MKVYIKPHETLYTHLMPDGEKVIRPIQDSPFYRAVTQGSPMPIFEYLNMDIDRNYAQNCVLLSNVMWTLSLVEIIKQQGFTPGLYASWPKLASRLVVDGLRRVSICAALGLDVIEVENTIQSMYQWWSQAFQVGDGWIDVAFPPGFEPMPGARQECDKTWNAFSRQVPLMGKTVLDLGCGPGFFCHRAIDAGASSVTGIDRNCEILQTTNEGLVQDVIAQANDVAWLLGYDKIRFIAKDLNSFTGGNQQWDVVFALRVHYHMANPTRFLKVASKIAKEALVVQCNPVHGLEAGTVDWTKGVLSSLWGSVAHILNGELPILVCKEKKNGY